MKPMTLLGEGISPPGMALYDALSGPGMTYLNGHGWVQLNGPLDDLSPTMQTFFWVLDAASAGLSAYHGYKRNRGSIGWAVVWGALGGLAPIITPAIAFAQGFGKRA